LEGGLRWDYRQMKDIRSNAGHIYPNQEFNNVSYNVGGVYKFSDLLKLNANVSSAWRAPQINELYSNGLHHGAARIEIGNTHLKSERAYNIQSAIHWNTEKIQMEAGVYFKRINDFIFLKPTWPPQLTIRGAFPTFEYSQTDARLAGIDFSLSGRLTEHLQLGGKASLLRARDLLADDWIIQMPSDRYEGEIGYRFGDSKRWHESYITVQVLHVTEQTRVPAEGNIEKLHPDGSVTYESDYAPPPPAYTLLGVEAGSEIIIGKQSFSVVMTVSNLLNVDYRDYMNSFRYYCADMGRNVALKIRIPIVITR
jgi:iron complex outermembrane recepter protein